MSSDFSALAFWYESHGLEAIDLAEWGAVAGPSHIQVPVHTIGGAYAFTVTRWLLREDVRYSVAPPHARPGTVLYGMNRTCADIKRKDHAYVVEGFSDVMALAKLGIPDVCGLLTSRVTQAQLALLALIAGQATFWFDGDETGEGAAVVMAERAPKIEEEYGLQVQSILVDGADPSELDRESIEILTVHAQVLYEEAACVYFNADLTVKEILER